MTTYSCNGCPMKHQRLLTLCALILLAFCAVEGAAALDITITPDHIESGDTVTIDVAGLANGSTFALRMESAVSLGGQDEFSFEATNVNIPFSLNSPVVQVRAEPVTRAGLRAQTGGTAKSIEAIASNDVVKPPPGARRCQRRFHGPAPRLRRCRARFGECRFLARTQPGRRWALITHR